MVDWTIRVAQSPIGFGTPYKHNIIVVVDPAGRAVYEINGGPVGADGKIVPFNDRRGPLAYLSGDFPAGAARSAAGTLFYRPDLDQRVAFSGTEEQVRNRIRAADACIDSINSAGERYTLLTGPRGGREAPSRPTFNSNSVNASLLQCMGIGVDDPAITSQPGYQNPILKPDQVQQIIEQQNPTGPPAASPPAGNIPIPRPQPQKRGDDWDGSNGPSLGQAAPYAGPMATQAGLSVTGGSSLPQHVIDTGNYLRANGIEITPRTMYVANVLGPQGAVDLFKRTGSTSSDAVPSPDTATGQQMRAWARQLRLGPVVPAGPPAAPDFGASVPPAPAAQAAWSNPAGPPLGDMIVDAGLPLPCPAEPVI
jgi:hypothetical protein